MPGIKDSPVFCHKTQLPINQKGPNFWINQQNPIKGPFLLLVLKSRNDWCYSFFWTSIWNPTKWPFILFVLKSRNSPIKRLFILLVKKRRDVRCYYKFWTSIWNPIKWPFILLPSKRRFRNCSLFRKSTKLTIFKHCCDLDGLKAQQEKGLIHLITHRFAASLVKVFVRSLEWIFNSL